MKRLITIGGIAVFLACLAISPSVGQQRTRSAGRIAPQPVLSAPFSTSIAAIATTTTTRPEESPSTRPMSIIPAKIPSCGKK